MITRTMTGLGLMLLMAGGAAAQTAPATYLTLESESRLWVEGTSTVRGFSCNAGRLNVMVEVSSEHAVAATLAGEKAVRAVRVEVPARSLDCDNGTMNDHMYKALKADEHSAIVFRLTGYEIGPGGVATINGSLQLGGQQRSITLQADVKPGAGGTMRVTGTQTVKLSDYGLRAPSLMMGTMKVGDAVQVRYDLLLRP